MTYHDFIKTLPPIFQEYLDIGGMYQWPSLSFLCTLEILRRNGQSVDNFPVYVRNVVPAKPAKRRRQGDIYRSVFVLKAPNGQCFDLLGETNWDKQFNKVSESQRVASNRRAPLLKFEQEETLLSLEEAATHLKGFSLVNLEKHWDYLLPLEKKYKALWDKKELQENTPQVTSVRKGPRL